MLSVVIATHESERVLVRTLAALVSGAAAGMVRDVLIADAGSNDETATVADMAGCRLMVSSAPLAARLRAAAATARTQWLMFLRPGTAPDVTWIGEAARFIEDAERTGQSGVRAAVFRPDALLSATGPALIEALVLLKAALGGRAKPDQGLLISRTLYERLGGHRDAAADCEADLLRRLGRRRTVMLRAGITVTTI